MSGKSIGSAPKGAPQQAIASPAPKPAPGPSPPAKQYQQSEAPKQEQPQPQKQEKAASKPQYPDGWATKGPTEGLRDSDEAIIVCLAPDVCRSPTVPVPYMIVDFCGHDTGYTPSVRFTGHKAMVFRSKTTHVHGDEPGTGLGIKSGTVKNISEPIEHSKSVGAEKSKLIRHMDRFWMNNKNTVGEAIFVKNTRTYERLRDDDPVPGSMRKEGGQKERDDPSGPALSAFLSPEELIDFWDHPLTKISRGSATSAPAQGVEMMADLVIDEFRTTDEFGRELTPSRRWRRRGYKIAKRTPFGNLASLAAQALDPLLDPPPPKTIPGRAVPAPDPVIPPSTRPTPKPSAPAPLPDAQPGPAPGPEPGPEPGPQSEPSPQPDSPSPDQNQGEEARSEDQKPNQDPEARQPDQDGNDQPTAEENADDEDPDDDDNNVRISAPRCPALIITFTMSARPRASRFEMRRQLDLQQGAINRKSPCENARDIENNRGKKRNDRNLRNEETRAIRRRMAESLQVLNPGLGYAEALALATAQTRGLHAIHTLDAIAGGNPNEFTGLGGGDENSHIGNQWQHGRRDQLSEHAKLLCSNGCSHMQTRLLLI